MSAAKPVRRDPSDAVWADALDLLREQIEALRGMQGAIARHVAAGELDDATMRDAAAVTRAIQGACGELRQMRKAEAARNQALDPDRVWRYLRELSPEDRDDLIRSVEMHDGRNLLG